MKTIRPAVLSAVVLTLLVSLSGCFFAPSTGGGTTDPGTDPALVGTTWGGTDSDGDTWEFEFQPDNTVGLTFNGASYDDASDTWALAGGTLTISVAFDDGTATLAGAYADGASSIDLDGTQGAATWTVTITEQ